MLGRNILVASTALVASMALTACDNNGGGVGTLGVDTVMSADHGSVRVTDTLATMEVTDFTINDDGDLVAFTIELGLPDGTPLTLTEADLDGGINIANLGSHSGHGHVLEVNFENAGDKVEVFIGLGLDAPNSISEEDLRQVDADNALFALVRVDVDGDDPNGGFYTYMVDGNETAALPAGEASYRGESLATIYRDGELVSHETGSATIDLNLAQDTAHLEMHDGGSVEYHLSGDLAVNGTGYSGEITGIVDTCGFGCSDVDVTGDALGQFYGDLAEATAGVFGASGLDADEGDEPVEIVGGFAAYDEGGGI